MVTRAKTRKSPTGSVAIAPNSITVRAKTGWLLRYRPTLDSINRVTWKRRISFSLKEIEKIEDLFLVTYSGDSIWGYFWVFIKAVQQRGPSFLHLLQVSHTAVPLHLHTVLTVGKTGSV